MYRPDDIKKGLAGLWGWRQGYDPDTQIAPSLTTSETGQYFQEVHPMLTLENIKAIMPRFDKVDYPEWDAATVYAAGSKVQYNDKGYRALTDNTNQQPDISLTSWEPFDDFSEWIEEKTEASIIKCIRTFWDEKMAGRTAKNLLEYKALFNGAGRITDLEKNYDNLVGFEITPIRANGIVATINKIGLQFKGTGDVTLYLYHSSRMVPLKTETFTRTRDGGMQWFDVSNWLLPYLSQDTDAGGSWFLVYDQNEVALTGQQAVRQNRDWSERPCSYCDQRENAAYNIWSKYLEIHPFKLTSYSERFAQGELWDIADNLYTYTTNYGINLQITISCDITDVILQHKQAFQSVIGLQVASDFLREFVYNPNFRVNRAQENFAKGELLYELDGDSQGYKKSGINYELKQAMRAVQIDTTSLSRICFPCNNGGVRFRTV